MANKAFAPVAGDLVISRHKRGIFKVLAISHGEQTAAVQSFNISKQQLLGQPIEDLKDLQHRLSYLSVPAVEEFYRSAHHRCSLRPS